MASEETRDAELVGRLRRLEAGAAAAAPSFDYDGMLERHARGLARVRRRGVLVRSSAAALVLAALFASLWRLGADMSAPPASVAHPPAAPLILEPRIVRADTYFALATLEDHIASVDEALNHARLRGGGAEVASLERTRAELLDSYTQVRYAEMVSANF